MPNDSGTEEAKNGSAVSGIGGEWNANSSNTSPWNPDTIVTSRGGDPAEHLSAGNGGSFSSRQICVARFAYTACQPDELSIQRGDRVCVLEKSSDGWWHGVLLPPEGSNSPATFQQQQTGWFPSNYVTMESAPIKPSVPGYGSSLVSYHLSCFLILTINSFRNLHG